MEMSIGLPEGAAASAAFFLASPKPQVIAELETLRYPDEMFFTHQVCAQLRERPFTEVRETAEKLLTGHQGQNRIAKKLQLFVVGRLGALLWRLQRLQFTRLRAVRERLLDELGTLEVVPQQSFKCRNFSRFHESTAGELATAVRQRNLLCNEER